MSRIPWWRTTFGEEEIHRIAAAIQSEHISQGPIVAEFEHSLGETLAVPHVVATTSGSMALLMSMIAIGVGPEDEVIVPNRTWISTAHAPHLLGAKVVLVDVEPFRPIIDVSKIAEKITSRTKAIIPVHLNGRAANMRAINQLAASRGIHVVEDAAQALGSRNADGFLGTQSQLGCFSLSVAKIIATGQGGFVVTRDAAMADKLRAIRTHGVADVVNATWLQPGFNFRFTDIQAAFGLAQLKKLAGRITRVKEIYARYAEALRGLSHVTLIPVNVEASEIPLYTEVLCDNRGSLMKALAAAGIDSRPFYPDLNEAAYFGNCGSYPNSRAYSRDGIYLPCGPDQPPENIELVINTVHRWSCLS